MVQNKKADLSTGLWIRNTQRATVAYSKVYNSKAAAAMPIRKQIKSATPAL
jgi:hypothetical protein